MLERYKGNRLWFKWITEDKLRARTPISTGRVALRPSTFSIWIWNQLTGITHTFTYILIHIGHTILMEIKINFQWQQTVLKIFGRALVQLLQVVLVLSCLGLCLRPIRQISLPDCELHEYGRRLESSTRSPLVNVLACSGFMRLPDWVCVSVCVWGCFKLQLIYVNGFAKYLQHFGERYDDDY